MIKDDVLVFDCVAHPFNFDPSNALGQPGEQFINHLYAFHNVLTPESEPKLAEDEFLKEWSTAEIARMVFDESETDMLIAMRAISAVLHSLRNSSSASFGSLSG